MPYRDLKDLNDYVEPAFANFYEQLLSDEVFATHFRDEAHVRSLLVRQKENFHASLDDTAEAFFQRFYRIGVLHYDIGVPYEAFLSGAKILRKSLISQIIHERRETRLILVVNDYFETSSESMAKGYLDRFIRDDADEIANVVKALQDARPRQDDGLLVRHYRWLMVFFDAIRTKDEKKLESLDAEKEEILRCVGRVRNPLLTGMGVQEVDRIYERISNNARNILFFLERDIYTEALSLFVNLLEIYKFALIFSNVVSVYLAHTSDEIIALKTRQAEEDPLTGAIDRIKFDELMGYAFLTRSEHGQSFAVVLMDLDWFKRVNDQFGHQSGDDVLRSVAGVVSRVIRKNDLFVRYGGEEFVVLCLDTDLAGAARLAEKIRIALASYRFEKVGQVTASFGVAECEKGDDATSLFAGADEALYRAKGKGRNRVETGFTTPE